MHLSSGLKFFIKASTNFHRPGAKPDIFLFATPRGGSTWVMEILASQPGIKFFDEPLSPRRENVARGGVIRDYESLMPDSGDTERIIGFLKELQCGDHGYMNVAPFRRNHRFFTDRCVFKIHEIEHLMHRVEDECRAQVVYLLRHPVATSISRRVLPRLPLFLSSAYYDRLIEDERRLADIKSIARTGSTMQQAVVSWCYENVVPLRDPAPTWLTVTYEELVLNPCRACDLLLTTLQMADRRAMMSSFETPAANIMLSHSETLDAMRDGDAEHRRRRLIEKWRDKIDATQIAHANEVLQLFAIDAYDASQLLAHRRYIHFDDTIERIS